MAKMWDTTDYLWREAPATKLASLFKVDETASQSEQSFRYTAPKRPRGSSVSLASQVRTLTPPTSVPALLFATAVHAFRYVNGEHKKLGRIGAAVLGNHVTREYRILLYYSQQEHVTSATVRPEFVFTVQPGNYGSFYDDCRENWSVMFESEKARADFCREVCLAKRNSTPFLESVTVQDLVLGEGHPAETGDTLEVNYTGWVLQDYTIGQMFDSTVRQNKPLQVRIGAGKVIKGLEQGMLGSREGGRRFLVVPPTPGYRLQGVLKQVPANSTLIFEVEIHQVKPAKDKGLNFNSAECQYHELSGSPPSMSTLSPTTIPNKQGDSTLFVKSRLLKQLSNTSVDKDNLMSHVVRVGQPKLPLLSEAVPASPIHSGLNTSTTIECTDSSVETTQQLPANTVLYQAEAVKSFLMMEARQHSTEIRLAVGKVGEKVDLLTSKVDELQRQWCSPLGMPPVSMEIVTLMHNIQRIIQENEALKDDLSEKSSHIQEQNIKIGELINRVQRYMQENDLLLEQKNNMVQAASEQNQARLLQAEQEKVRLAEELASSSSHLSLVQLEAVSHQRRVGELQLELRNARQDSEKHVARVASLEMQVTELMEQLELMQVQHCAERLSCKEAELKACRLENDLQDVKMDKERLEQTLANRNQKWQEERQRCAEELEEVRQSCLLKGGCQDLRPWGNWNGSGAVPQQLSRLRGSNHPGEKRLPLQHPQKEELLSLRAMVKQVINTVFHVLKGQFELQEMYCGQAVLGTIMNTMRTVTLQLLDDIELACSKRAKDNEDAEEESGAKFPQEDQQCDKEQELLEDAEDKDYELQVSLKEESILKMEIIEATARACRQAGEFRPSETEHNLENRCKEQDPQLTRSKSDGPPEGGQKDPIIKYSQSRVEECRLKEENPESSQSKSSDFTERKVEQRSAASTHSKMEDCQVKELDSESSQSKVKACPEGELKEQRAPYPSWSREVAEDRAVEHEAGSNQSGSKNSTEGGIID